MILLGRFYSSRGELCFRSERIMSIAFKTIRTFCLTPDNFSLQGERSRSERVNNDGSFLLRSHSARNQLYKYRWLWITKKKSLWLDFYVFFIGFASTFCMVQKQITAFKGSITLGSNANSRKIPKEAGINSTTSLDNERSPSALTLLYLNTQKVLILISHNRSKCKFE